jgi:hypothetical protein
MKVLNVSRDVPQMSDLSTRPSPQCTQSPEFTGVGIPMKLASVRLGIASSYHHFADVGSEKSVRVLAIPKTSGSCMPGALRQSRVSGVISMTTGLSGTGGSDEPTSALGIQKGHSWHEQERRSARYPLNRTKTILGVLQGNSRYRHEDPWRSTGPLLAPTRIFLANKRAGLGIDKKILGKQQGWSWHGPTKPLRQRTGPRKAALASTGNVGCRPTCFVSWNPHAESPTAERDMPVSAAVSNIRRQRPYKVR